MRRSNEELELRKADKATVAKRSGTCKTVYAALAGNLLIAATKFIAAGLTGSSAMLSEAAHSLVDTVNEVLLLYGLQRASLPADRAHPLGHGRELYFWSFIVAVLIFGLGAGVSFYEGITHIMRPEPIGNFALTYAVLGLSFLFEGGSWWVGIKEFSHRKGRLTYFDAARQTKDPALLAVVFEDSAALLGLVVAFVGIAASQYWGIAEFDGAASVGIGAILSVAAIFLARQTKALLLGESASGKLESAILQIAGGDPAVDRANGVLTVHLSPDQIVVALSAQFQENRTARDIEDAVERVEARIKAEHPEVTTLFVKPQAWQKWHDR